MTVNLTIITPTYNEEESIVRCIQAVKRMMSNDLPALSYEHIVIDNYSTDGTVALIDALCIEDSNLKLIVNGRNIGATRSIYRAMARAQGEWVIPMLAADLQDPVEAIPKMYAKIKSGVNVVYGVRTNRQESLIMRTLRSVYYRLIRRFSESDIPINVGDFSLIHSDVSKAIVALDDQYPYVRGLIAQSASKVDYVPYRWAKRASGKSKSKPLVLIDVAISGMVSTTQIPARIALIVGFITSTLGFGAGLVYLGLTLSGLSSAPPGIPTIVVSMFTLMGMQLFFLGLIGEYVLSIHRQIKREPISPILLEKNF